MDYCHDECVSRFSPTSRSNNESSTSDDGKHSENSTTTDADTPSSDGESGEEGEVEACERRCMSVQVNECLVPYTGCMGECPLHHHSPTPTPADQDPHSSDPSHNTEEAKTEEDEISEHMEMILVQSVLQDVLSRQSPLSYAAGGENDDIVSRIYAEKEVADDECVGHLHHCINNASTSCLTLCSAPQEQIDPQQPSMLRSQRGCYGRCMVDAVNTCSDSLSACMAEHPSAHTLLKHAIARVAHSKGQQTNATGRAAGSAEEKQPHQHSRRDGNITRLENESQEAGLAVGAPAMEPVLKECVEQCRRDKDECFRLMDNFCNEECDRREAEYQKEHANDTDTSEDNSTHTSIDRKHGCLLACDDHNSATCVRESEKCNSRCLSRHSAGNGTEQLRMWLQQRGAEEEEERKKHRLNSSDMNTNTTDQMNSGSPDNKNLEIGEKAKDLKKLYKHKDRYERSHEKKEDQEAIERIAAEAEKQRRSEAKQRAEKEKYDRSQRIPRRSKPLSSQAQEEESRTDSTPYSSSSSSPSATHSSDSPSSPTSTDTNCSSECVEKEQQCRAQAEAACISERNQKLQMRAEHEEKKMKEGTKHTDTHSFRTLSESSDDDNDDVEAGSNDGSESEDISQCLREKQAQCATVGAQCSLRCRVGLTKRSLTRIEVTVPPEDAQTKDEDSNKQRVDNCDVDYRNRNMPSSQPRHHHHRPSSSSFPHSKHNYASSLFSSLSSPLSKTPSSSSKSPAPVTIAVAETALDAKRKLDQMTRIDETRMKRIEEGYVKCSIDCVEAEQKCIDECNEEDPLIQIHPISPRSSTDETPKRMQTLGQLWREGALFTFRRRPSTSLALSSSLSPSLSLPLPRRNATSRGYRVSTQVRKELAKHLGSDELRACVGECDGVHSQCLHRCQVARDVLADEVRRVAGEKKQSLIGMTRRRIHQLEGEQTKTNRETQHTMKIQEGLAFSLEDFVEADILASPEKKNQFKRQMQQTHTKRPHISSSPFRQHPSQMSLSSSTLSSSSSSSSPERLSPHRRIDPDMAPSLDEKALKRALTKLILEDEEIIHFSIDGKFPIDLTELLITSNEDDEKQTPSILIPEEEEVHSEPLRPHGSEEDEEEEEEERDDDEESDRDSLKEKEEEEEHSESTIPPHLRSFAAQLEQLELRKKFLSDQCDITGVHFFSTCIEDGNMCLEEGRDEAECKQLVERCLITAVIEHDSCEADLEQEYADALQELKTQNNVSDEDADIVKAIVTERLQKKKLLKYKKASQANKERLAKKQSKTAEKAQKKKSKIEKKLQKTLDKLFKTQESSSTRPSSQTLFPECEDGRSECYNSCHDFEERCLRRQQRNNNSIGEDDSALNCRRAGVECGLECDTGYRKCVEEKMKGGEEEKEGSEQMQYSHIKDALKMHHQQPHHLRNTPMNSNSTTPLNNSSSSSLSSSSSSSSPDSEAPPPPPPPSPQSFSSTTPQPGSIPDTNRWDGMTEEDCAYGADRCSSMCQKEYPGVKECLNECDLLKKECVDAVSSAPK